MTLSDHFFIVVTLDVDYRPWHKIPRLRLLEFLGELQFEPTSPYDIKHGSLRGEILKAKAAEKIEVHFCAATDIVDDYGKPLTWRAVTIYEVWTSSLQSLLEVIDTLLHELSHTARYRVSRYSVYMLTPLMQKPCA